MQRKGPKKEKVKERRMHYIPYLDRFWWCRSPFNVGI